MSDSNGPARRRRIAGESKPAAPAKRPTADKPLRKPVAPATKAPAAKKAAAGPKAPVAKKAPTAKRAPAAKQGAASRAPVVAATPAVAPTKTAAAPKPARANRTPIGSPPPAARTTPAEPTGTPPLRRLVPMVFLAVVALVAGVLLMVQGVRQISGGGNDFGPAREQASSAAGSAAETIFSFRYDKLDEHLTASKALMTPKFGKEFDKIAPALTELAPQRKIVVEAVTRDAAALACGDECSGTKANVLVFVDQARLVGGSKEPTVFANRISVSMVKTADGWLVDNIRAL